MAMALGGRWGRSEDSEAAETTTEAGSSSAETMESEVIEASEVRTENDPWE